ncbi:hypothetical protein LuPra_00099 [Luteitalea pratensis]|uniref:Uncharacterized protein n=1 Tax=Luteitalea pratensis TaxID=1855912 RepID=A0A143PEI9_LUTPR|nr:hypothetical protein [Luteitalea pratensis]AMY06935.1 hypothetical protein LuPra_00099 [Luteitalea pratensis]
MTDELTGPEQFTDEDRRYSGSRFRDVVDALFANPYQTVWGREGEPPLPDREQTIKSVFGGLLARGRSSRFEGASARTLDSAADLRWGSDRKGFARFLHPTGVCLVGRWQITEDTPYSGYFRRASKALVVARYSSGGGGNRRGRIRSLALVGKLFPTMDPDHHMPLRTANFITQQDIGGERSDSINAAELRNAPDVTVFRRGPAGTLLIKVASVFRRVDAEPTIRQLYPIAELGKAGDEPTRAPAFMRLLVAPEQPVIAGEDLDVRDEVMAQIFDRGDPVPKRTLTFTIDVTDDGDTSGTPFRVRRTFRNWRRIGSLVFDNAVVSHNGDAVIHFAHPTWRQDRDDPATATRLNKVKVR